MPDCLPLTCNTVDVFCQVESLLFCELSETLCNELSKLSASESADQYIESKERANLDIDH